jgi:hypothetical protein
MGILNKRNAVLGWTAWKIGKRVLRRKARGAVPGRVEGSRRPNASAIVSALAALGGALWFWRRRKPDEETPVSE